MKSATASITAMDYTSSMKKFYASNIKRFLWISLHSSVLLVFIFMVFFSVGTKAQSGKSMHHQELQKYLPATIKGFSPDSEPNGNTITLGEQVFSTVEQNFTKDELYLKITLFDYAQAIPMFEQSALIWSQGFSIENSEGYARSLKFSQPDVAGWETYDNDSQTAEIFIGVKNRFFIIINAEGQSGTAFIKTLADPIINQLGKL
jgi:hypothetical protein